MPIDNYSVLKGVASDFALDDDNSPHLEIKIEASGSHRIAINVRSKIAPHDLLYLRLDNFKHPVTDKLKQLDHGLHKIDGVLSDIALNYVHGDMLQRDQMLIVPYEHSGPQNDLRDYMEPIIKGHLNDDQVHFYAFGEPWGPDPGSDKYFGFSPKMGIHNIHMNQGSKGSFSGDNGAKQDGALLVHFLTEDRWVAFFLAFQSQSWNTDPNTGHPSNTNESPTGGSIRILAALVTPYNPEKGKECVTLLNRSDSDVDLTGWYIADKEETYAFRCYQGRCCHAGSDRRITTDYP